MELETLELDTTNEVAQDFAFVYALCEPITHRVFYVGVTCDLRQRYRSHLSAARLTARSSPRTKTEKYMHKVLSKGMLPELLVLEKTSVENRLACEKKWARKITLEIPLKNVRGFELTTEERMSAFGINTRLLAMVELAAATLRDSGLSETANTLTEAASEAKAIGL